MYSSSLKKNFRNSAASSGYFAFLKIIQGSASTWASCLFPGRPVWLHHHPKVLGIAHLLRRVLLDVAGATTMALVHRGGLAGGKVSESVQITVAQPSRGQDGVVELLIEIQHLDDLLFGEGGPARLEVEEPTSVGPGQLRHQDVDEQGNARERETVARHPSVRGIPLHHGLGHLDKVIPGLRWLQSLRLEDVLAVYQEVRCWGGVGDAIVLPFANRHHRFRTDSKMLSFPTALAMSS